MSEQQTQTEATLLQRGALVHRDDFTLPDKPNSRLQQYRLTEQGKALLT